jgi:biopolymer transport protein ExbD
MPALAVSEYGMDPYRLRILVAPALVSLFLMLSLCAFVAQTPRSVGVHFPMTRVRTISFSDCYDDRDIFVKMKKDGSIWINETQQQPGKLGPKIAEIMQSGRSQRVVYVLTDPEVPYGDFASSFNAISISATDLHVGVITPQLDGELRQCPLGSVCGLDWPDHGYLYSCVAFNIPPVYGLHSPVR